MQRSSAGSSDLEVVRSTPYPLMSSVRRLGLVVLFLFAAGLAMAPPAGADTHIATTTYSSNTTWTTAGSPYILDGNVTVASGAALTIDPGVIVKFNGGARELTVNGTLTAVGSAGSPIYFTSLQDDSVGGDTGRDGPTVGAASQWNDILIQNGAQATLTYVDARYGGYSTG